MTILLEAPGVRAEVDPARGARLVSLSLHGFEVLGGSDDPAVDPAIGQGCYAMVPWAGRIRDGLIARDGTTHVLPTSSDGHAVHGTGKDSTWDHLGDGIFRTSLGEPWPTPGDATLTYEPRANGLRITLRWQSDDFGCSLGVHPWFRRQLTAGAPLELDVRPTSMVERAADGLPTGRLVEPGPHPWDDCFTLARSPVLRWPGALMVTLASDAAWWVIYDRPATTLCVEPQTAPPDVFAHPSLQPSGPWPRQVVLDLSAAILS